MPTLYDHRGQPVRPTRLQREQAVGSITSVRSPYAPLVAPGLTPVKLQDIIRRATEGDHADYLALADEMERRDGNYFSALQTRRLAVQQLERTVEASSEDAQDTKVAEAVGAWLESPAFGKALGHILDATAKGFSVTEILWSRTEELWTPVAFKPRPQRWFAFDHLHAETLHLVDGTPDGEALEPFKFVVHEPHVLSGSPLAGGLARIVAALHVFKGYAVKDWMAFAEVFGMPIRIGQYQQGASDEDKEDLREAVTALGSDAAAIIPATMSIIFERAAMSGSAGGDEFFKTLANWLNREVNKTVLGTNLVDEDGGSFAKAQVLDLLRKDIRNSDAWQLADTVQRDIVRPFVDLNFGPRARVEDYPLANLDTSEPENIEALANALAKLVPLGLPVATRVILEKLGLPQPEPDDPLLSAPVLPAPGDEDGPPDEGDADDEREAEKAAAAAKLRALLARIEREAEGTTNMRKFRARLREMVGAAT